jgi:hypothetical protein
LSRGATSGAPDTEKTTHPLRLAHPAGQWNLIFASGDDSLPRFWRRRSYDFDVWSLKKGVEKLHYMHMNPLKRKLVDHPKEWPWSSFSYHSNLKHGLIRVDPVN